MTTKSVRAFRGTAVAFFAAGFLFLLTENSVLGLGLLMLGIAFMVRSTKQGGSIAQEHPLIFALITAALLVITVIFAAALLLPKFL